ncbi:MAG TPA: SH3 domain-containing protein, partial [Symbiobacteriaceae bacterium]|nr:SH3 domain-containing protein [Symbiobacteriaceae bacterium]
TTYQSDSGIGRMEADRDGKSFRLLPDYGTDAPPFRYTWEGKPLPYLTGDVAPTGKQTLTREWVQGFTPSLVVQDAATGAPQLRLVGAEQCYGYAIAGSHWTADVSAILFGARDGFYMAGTDGSLRQPPAFNTKDEWHEPFPSPTDPKLFVDRVETQGTNAWRLEIVEESGKKVQSATFEGNLGSLWPVGPLWHPSGTFVQISWYNRGGTGAPCGDYRIPLAPVVQKPPFPEQLSLTVAGTGDCLNVRTEPSVSAQVVACLKDGTKVTVAPDANQVAQIWGDQRQWARVKTADGKAGWASVEEQYLHFSQ